MITAIYLRVNRWLKWITFESLSGDDGRQATDISNDADYSSMANTSLEAHVMFKIAHLYT